VEEGEMGREGDREIKNILIQNAPACADLPAKQILWQAGASAGRDFGMKSNEKIKWWTRL